LLALYEASGEVRWLEEAQAIADTMLREFWDEQAGGFFYTGKAMRN
jgi:uncharacterized protein YyaL (SSP411 family)